MKIIIIFTQRSGSTFLSKQLIKLFNIENPFIEPYNFDYGENPHYLNLKKQNEIFPDSSLFKTTLDMLPHGYDRDDSDVCLEYYSKVIKQFDKVILLSRFNLVEVYESVVYRLFASQYINGPTEWHTPYFFEGNIPFDITTFDYLKKHKENIEKFSKKINIPITWYEELYSGYQSLIDKSVKHWGIDYNFTDKDFDPKKRYRKFTKMQPNI